MNHTGPRTFAKRIQFCRQPFGKGPGILSKQRQVDYVFFPGKTGAETERIRFNGANNHHVTWFILPLDFKISWIPISGTTRIPLTHKVWRPTLKNNYPARGCSNRISYVYFCGSKKKQLVEISWNTAPLEQSKRSTLATPTVDCWWTKFCTTLYGTIGWPVPFPITYVGYSIMFFQINSSTDWRDDELNASNRLNVARRVYIML